MNRRVDAIRRASKWGVTKKLVPVAVYQELATLEGLKKGRTAAPDPPPVRPVPADDLEKTLPQLSPVVRDMVTLQLLSGVRPGELCGLRPCDLDRSGEVWDYRPASHKTAHQDKERVICFWARGQAVLIPYLEGRGPDTPCFRRYGHSTEAREDGGEPDEAEVVLGLLLVAGGDPAEPLDRPEEPLDDDAAFVTDLVVTLRRLPRRVRPDAAPRRRLPLPGPRGQAAHMINYGCKTNSGLLTIADTALRHCPWRFGDHPG